MANLSEIDRAMRLSRRARLHRRAWLYRNFDPDDVEPPPVDDPYDDDAREQAQIDADGLEWAEQLESEARLPP